MKVLLWDVKNVNEIYNFRFHSFYYNEAMKLQMKKDSDYDVRYDKGSHFSSIILNISYNKDSMYHQTDKKKNKSQRNYI